MPVNVTYYFLYLLEATDSYREKFDDISERVRVETDNLKKLYPDFIGEPVNNSEDWCKLTGTIDSGKAEVKYYKERIILTVDTKFDTENLNELFKKAKIKRDKLLENVFVKSIEENLCSLCQDCIRSVYLYPLIEIYKDYKQTNFKLNDEAITTLTLSD